MTSKELPQPPIDPFGFTEHEKLWDRISDTRFRALIADAATTIHKVEIDANNYGEFAFVTVSREADGQHHLLTFWGMGFHEYRERWITDHWQWYRANSFPKTLEQQLTREEAKELLQQRREEIAPYLSEQTQTPHGRLFAMIADMSDDDGAISEMEDLGDWWNDLSDGLGEGDEA